MSGNLVSIPPHGSRSTARNVERHGVSNAGICVGCLLSCGLDGEMHDGQTLDDEFDQTDMSAAD